MTEVSRARIQDAVMRGDRVIKGVMKSGDIDSSGGVEIDGW